jgi:hypothetical protein
LAGRLEERFDTTLAIRLEHGEGVVRNVSASGMYFITDIALEEGAPVTFKLHFAGHPGGTLMLQGRARVVRIEPRDGKHGVGAAVMSFEFVRAGRKTDAAE